MSSYYNNKVPKVDDLIFSKYHRQASTRKNKDQQDNESLNTMDYYKEDESFQNQPLVQEDEVTPNQSVQIERGINQAINDSCSLILNKTCSSSGKSSESNKNQNLKKNKLSLCRTDAKNVQKRLESSKTCNDYCSRCNAEIGFSTKACPYCLKPLCLNCLKQIFNRNLDNNDDLDNFDQNVVNEKVCPNCRNLLSINNFVILKNKKKSSPTLTQNINEPMDSILDSTNNVYAPRNYENSVIIKQLKEESNEYDLLMKKILQKKKEIEIKKNIGINNLQTMIKAIEYEFKLNTNKLDDMIEKFKKIKETIEKRKNKIEQQQRSDSNSIHQEQTMIGKFKIAMNNFNQNYDKLSQKMILKSKQKAYKLHESNPLTINIAETYCMKYKKVIENNNIGNVYFKIERFVNSYVNYLVFSVYIKQDEKDSKDNKIKSKYIVNMEINGHLIKLNKSNKDENKSCLNYENIMQENKALDSKCISNNEVKNKELNIRLIISELFL